MFGPTFWVSFALLRPFSLIEKNVDPFLRQNINGYVMFVSFSKKIKTPNGTWWPVFLPFRVLFQFSRNWLKKETKSWKWAPVFFSWQLGKQTAVAFGFVATNLDFFNMSDTSISHLVIWICDHVVLFLFSWPWLRFSRMAKTETWQRLRTKIPKTLGQKKYDISEKLEQLLPQRNFRKSRQPLLTMFNFGAFCCGIWKRSQHFCVSFHEVKGILIWLCFEINIRLLITLKLSIL